MSQWTVGDDYSRLGQSNYRFSTDSGTHGRYYEFVNAHGESRVTVLHTNDGGLHAHAGKPKGNATTADFKLERYAKIIDPKTGDHHLWVRC